MKLFAKIENVDERDEFDMFSEGIAMLFESEQQITDFLMNKIIDRFESFAKDNKEYGFDWEKIFYMHDEPKFCEVETNKYYCPFDFNKPIDYKKFINMDHEIFARIDKHNKDANENGPKYIVEKKVKTLQKKKQEVSNLEKEIAEVDAIKYPYLDRYKPKTKEVKI